MSHRNTDTFQKVQKIFIDEVTALQEKGLESNAELIINNFLEKYPDDYIALSFLAAIYANKPGYIEKALHLWSELVKLKPNDDQNWLNYAIGLSSRKRFEEALFAARRAVTLAPNSALAHRALGKSLHGLRRSNEAALAFKKAFQIDPSLDDILSEITMSIIYASPNAFEAAAQIKNIAAQHFSNVVPKDSHSITRKTKFNIGLLSGDLRRHPVGYFLSPLLPFFNRDQFTIYAYSTQNTENENSLTEVIKQNVDVWRDFARPASDDALFNQIVEDEIDFLIDFSGYSPFNRMHVLAKKPAPIQIEWFGFMSTTGLKTMDYILLDEICAPLLEKSLYSEKICYLDHSRLVLFKPDPLPEIKRNTKSETLVFACYQEVSKINSNVLQAWAKILTKSPKAQLHLYGRNNFPTKKIIEIERNRLKSHGLPVERIKFIQNLPYDEYLKSHNDVDVLLDTFPYPGGTTTVEALWMGVPTLTYATPGMIGRQGEGILKNVGLSDWVCQTVDEYTEKAILLAQGKQLGEKSLTELRENLRGMCESSPAANPKMMVENLEQILLKMWGVLCDQNGM